MTSAYDTGTIPEIKVHHRLRIAREAAHLEQQELAEKIGISRTSVSAAELGRTNPRKITLNAWALATGVPVSWLIDGSSPSTNPPDGCPQQGSNLRPADYQTVVRPFTVRRTAAAAA